MAVLGQTTEYDTETPYMHTPSAIQGSGNSVLLVKDGMHLGQLSPKYSATRNHLHLKTNVKTAVMRAIPCSTRGDFMHSLAL
jgi:hypothetical protein